MRGKPLELSCEACRGFYSAFPTSKSHEEALRSEFAMIHMACQPSGPFPTDRMSDQPETIGWNPGKATRRGGCWYMLEEGGFEALPEWTRMVFVDYEDGLVLASAAFVGDETDVVARATIEGAECAMHDGHVYVGVDWLGKQNETVKAAMDRLRQHNWGGRP